jgi:hypothetical protein
VIPSSKLRIEDVPISRLRKNPHNARSHSAEQIAKLKASVRTFGFVLLRGFSPISDQQLIWVIPGILLVIDVAWGSQVGFRSGVSN